MKIIVPALLALSFPIVALAAPAKSQIDARGVAALDKAVAFYQKPRSFSLSATQKGFYDGKTTRSSRLQISLQAPHRASLKVTLLNDKGQPIGTRAVRLMDAKSLYLSQSGESPLVQAVGATREAHEDGLKEVLGDMPGVALSVVVMALGHNPASDPDIKSVRYGEIRENGKVLKNVTVVRKTPDDATGITAEFRLDSRSYTVEKVVIQVKSGGKIGVIATEIGRPVSNWKGSQSATDAAVYNWKTLAPQIALSPPKPVTKISVDARASAVFARAAKSYGAAKGLSASWKGHDGYGDAASGALDFDRAGRLHLAEAGALEPLIVLDGKTRWSLNQSEDVDEKGRRTYSRIEADADEIYLEIQIADEPTGTLGELLSGGSPFDAEKVAMRVEIMQLQEFRATLLAPQSLDGQLCDLVRISEISVSDNRRSPLHVEQKTYWFARSDGRLMRLQNKIVLGSKEKSSADWRISAQTFNPKFAPDAFKFVPPKNAVLQTGRIRRTEGVKT